MAEIKEIIRCYNCGAILQSDNPEEVGYIKKEVLESERQSFFFCDECFEKERHHKPTTEPVIEKGTSTILKDAKEKNALFVYVINVFSFESSFSPIVNNVIKGGDILVVANKVDLLPKNIDLNKFKKYIVHIFLLNGLRIKQDNIVFSSLFDEKTTKDMLENIYERMNGRDVYLLGAKLSGKKTLIDSMLKFYSNTSRESIMTKKYPGTELRVMRIPLSKKSSIYDVPSIDDNNSILHELDRLTFKKVYLTKQVKPRRITLSSKHCLFIGGIAFIEVLNDLKITFDCYVSPNIDLVRVSKVNSDVKFMKAVEHKSVHPTLSRIKTIRDLDVYEVDINENGLRDIGIQGLGWLTFNADNQAFRVFLPHGVSLYTTSSKVLLKDKK